MTHSTNEHDGISDVVESMGTHEFCKMLSRLMRKFISFDYITIYAYRSEYRPVCLYNNVPDDFKAVVVDTYINSNVFLLDPFFIRAINGPSRGLVWMKEQKPDSFKISEYFLRHYRATEINDEIGFIFPHAGASCVVSLNRTNSFDKFEVGEAKALKSHIRLLTTFCMRHWQIWQEINGLSVLESTKPNGIMTPLVELLSEREREIATMILSGHSTSSIGPTLGISENTVKVHRRNIYKKLNISSQQELFVLFSGMSSKNKITKFRDLKLVSGRL